MFENMFESRGEMPVPRELKAATQDFNLLKSLLPSFSLTETFVMDLDEENPELDSRPPKWQKPGPKAENRAERGSTSSRLRRSTSGAPGKATTGANRRPNKPRQHQQQSRQQESDVTKQQNKQLGEFKAIVSMLTTFVPRQEVQLNICKQDTSYVIFIETQETNSLAHALYGIGEQWHLTKQEAPERLSSPMQVGMFQHFIETVQSELDRMRASPSSRSKAQEMGLLLEKDNKIPGFRRDPSLKKHVKDDRIEPLLSAEIKEILGKLLVLCTKERVIARFHGMRKLSEEYSSPKLRMFLEVGTRTQEAQETCGLLHCLNQSATWMGC